MNKTNKNEQGFSAVELIMVIVIIALIGVVGWMVYKNHHKTTTASVTTTSDSKQAPSTSTKATTTTPSSASYTSKVGSFTIQYPTSWTIVGYTGQDNTTQIPTSQMNGTESSFLLTSSSATSNSFGVWFTIGDSSSSTSSLNSSFTQIPYSQGTVLKSLSNGIGVWQANQTLVINGYSNPDTCTPFETVSSNAFGYKLNNGKYVDAAMSFCYAQGQTTTNTYSQQANSVELQQAINIVSSIKQS